MRARLHEVRHDVLLLGRHVDDAHPAALLHLVLVRIGALHVSALGEYEHRLLVRYEILYGNILHAALHDLGAAVVAVLLGDSHELLAHHGENVLRAREDLLEALDEVLDLLELVLDLLALERGELLEAHLEDGGRLDLREPELLLKRFRRARHVFRGADGLDDLVDVVERLREAKEDVLALLCLPELVLGATLHHLLAVRNEGLKHALKREGLRHAVHKGKHVVMEGALELRVLVDIVEHGLRVRGALKLDNHADVSRGLVAQILDALDLLVAYEVRDARDEVRLIHAVRDRGDDDVRSLLLLDDLRLATHHYAAAAGSVGMLDIALIKRNCAEREVRALHEPEQVVHGRIRVVYQMRGGVHDLAQVMRRDVRRHAHGDAERAVKKEVRHRSRKHARLLLRAVEVRVPVDRLLLEVLEHFVREARHLRLGITVRSRRVAIY